MLALKGLPTCQVAATLRTFDHRLAWALTTIAARYLTTVRPQARREFARWRQQAEAIADPVLQAHVLRPFDADLSTEGAALFAVLAPLRRQRQLVPLFVAYVLAPLRPMPPATSGVGPRCRVFSTAFTAA